MPDKTLPLTVTTSSHPDFRYFASLRGPDGRQKSERFNWPADLNQWVKRARSSAARHGYIIDVQDETGEVR
jgi:hypothetical protein